MAADSRIPRALSIAGSDSGGGAGIQADLKAFAACGVHGMTAITAITAQNTLGVTEIHPVPPATIIAQVRAVSSDIGVDAVKVGMLGSAATIEAVARALDELPRGTPVVLDPVMVAESGAELLEPSARAALIELLLPRATVATPNVPEARALLAAAAPNVPGARARLAAAAPNVPGARALLAAAAPNVPEARGLPAAAAPVSRSASPDQGEVATMARALRALGPRVVVVTGGHLEQAVDVFFDGKQLVELPGVRYPDGAAHGSGCTHSSVLAARLAWGDEPLAAARQARELAASAVRDGLVGLGAGPGPVDVLGLARRARPDG